MSTDSTRMHSKDDSKAPVGGAPEPEAGPTARIAAQPHATGGVRPRITLAPVQASNDEAEALSVDASVVELLERSGTKSARSGGSREPDSAPSEADRPPVTLADPRLGQTLLGRYRLDKLIGKGGMGRVYRATQFPLNRAVAVKILSPEFQRKDPQFVRRFFLEAASAARLTHPNTITVFDYGESEAGELFIVMEYLHGRPLSKLLNQEGPLSLERALHIATQICRALREAHGKGIIHRDLKPGNILLLEEGDDVDFVKVLDFGLVKVFTPPDVRAQSLSQEPLTPGGGFEGELTKAGMFLGSPKYMSPEQIQGAHLDTRTDIYSLGVLMCQMITGKVPYAGASSVEVIYKHVNAPVPRLKDLNPAVDLPDELEAVIRRCMDKNPERRFSSMGELLVRLKELRRSLTGVSMASMTGAGVDFRSQVAGPARIVDPGADPAGSVRPGSERQGHLEGGSSKDVESSQASMRPQMRPASGALVPGPTSPSPSSLPPVSVRPGPIPREPHVHEGETSLAVSFPGHRESSPPARPSGLMRVAPFLAASSLILALGVLAFVLAVPQSRNAGTGSWSSWLRSRDEVPGLVTQPPTHEAPKEAPRTLVRFSTLPEGAEVLVDGISLGVTPLERAIPNEGGDRRDHQVVFKLSGFKTETRDIRLDGTPVSLDVVLSKRPPTSGRSPPNAREEDYKDNPY